MVAIAICSTLPAHGRHERGRQIYQFPHWCWWSLQHPGRSSWIWWMASGICVEWDQQGQQMGCRHCLPHRSWDSFCGRDHQQQDLFVCSRGTPGFTLYCSSQIPSTSSMTWHWQPQTENPLTGNPWLNPFYILELATIYQLPGKLKIPGFPNFKAVLTELQKSAVTSSRPTYSICTPLPDGGLVIKSALIELWTVKNDGFKDEAASWPSYLPSSS